MLSESEIVKYGREDHRVLVGSVDWYRNVIPITASSTLALSITAGSWRIEMRTQGPEVHEAGEGDDPQVPGVDYEAAVELEDEPRLEACVSECSIRQRTDQESIGQPIVQEEHEIRNNTERPGVNGPSVSKWSTG